MPDDPEYIGIARMAEDGTITVTLRAEAPGGIRGHTMKVYEPNDPKYNRFLEHVGGLEAGEQKPVPPWS